jgi:hypothetical protein
MRSHCELACSHEGHCGKPPGAVHITNLSTAQRSAPRLRSTHCGIGSRQTHQMPLVCPDALCVSRSNVCPVRGWEACCCPYAVGKQQIQSMASTHRMPCMTRHSEGRTSVVHFAKLCSHDLSTTKVRASRLCLYRRLRRDYGNKSDVQASDQRSRTIISMYLRTHGCPRALWGCPPLPAQQAACPLARRDRMVVCSSGQPSTQATLAAQRSRGAFTPKKALPRIVYRFDMTFRIHASSMRDAASGCGSKLPPR